MNKNFSQKTLIWYDDFCNYMKEEPSANKIPNLNKMSRRDKILVQTTTLNLTGIMEAYVKNNELPINKAEFNFIENINYRTKSDASIIAKYESKFKNGTIKYKALFNDLAAYRIIINIEIEEFKKLIDTKKIKVIEHPKKQKNEKYTAIHLYLYQRSNPKKNDIINNIPWIEIQIWTKKDEKVNKEEHKKYKSSQHLRDIF